MAAAVFAASLVTAVLATRVFATMDAVRVKLVSSSLAPTAGEVRVETSGRPRILQLRAPFAVIASIHNQTSASGTFVIRIGQTDVCRVAVPAGDARRVDCVMTVQHTASSPYGDVVVESAAAAWSLDYLELATHHGATNGILFILPAAAAYGQPGWIWIVSVGAVFLGVAAVPTREVPRVPLRVFRAVAAMIAIALVTIWIGPWVTPYRVVISTGTFVGAATLLVLPQLAVIIGWLLGGLAARWSAVAPLAGSLLVALAVLWGYDALMRERVQQFFDGNYSGLLDISHKTFEHNPLLSGRDDVRQSLVIQDGGYDAQFMYYETFDPFLLTFHDAPEKYRGFIDAPPYRFGRIGFSLLTKIISFDQWRLYPVTMAWLILVAIAATAFLLSRLAAEAGASPAWGLVVLVMPCCWVSLQSALPEPIAAATVLGGYWSLRHERWLTAGALFALSLLVRETGIVLVVCLGAAAFLSGRRREALLMTTIGIAPIVFWRLYVGWVLFPDWRWEGFSYAGHNFGAPFAGFIDLWRAVAAGTYPVDLRRAAIMFPLLLVVALLLSIVIAIRRPTALTLATVFYAVLAVSLNYAAVWVHVGNGQRVSFEVFTLLAASSAMLVKPPRLLGALVAAFWTFAGVYMLYGSFDADFVRSTLL